KTMNASWSHHYDVIKKISSLSGQWPYQRPIMRLFCVILVTLSTISMIIPQIAKFIRCDGNLQCIFETMTSYMLTTVTLVKLYTCYFNRCKMKILIDQLFIDWNELETPEEYEIMKKYAKNGRRYSLGYSLYCYFAVYVFMSMSLIPQILDVVLPLNESRPILPTYPGYYFVDERKYFFYIFSHAIMAWEIAMTGIVTHDCMLLTYIEHVCSIFALVGFRFERLTYKHNDAVRILHFYTSDMYHKRIAFFVYTHRKALKFAQLIEDTFSLTLAVQIALNTIMISITLLQVTQQQAGMLEMIRYVMYVIGQLIHLFCLSFEGQKLIDHSLQIRNKIYKSLWYETSPKLQKMLLFVMQKSLRPIFLSAGKIYIFSMENFTMIVQTSMSYFTVLSSLMAKFITCDKDLPCIFETMTSLMLAIMSLVKLYTCYLNRYKQCEDKFKDLRKHYIKAKDQNEKSSGLPITVLFTCKFYTEMKLLVDEALGDKLAMKPVSIASTLKKRRQQR
ncbi:OR4 protein, partial [Acromyrmex charruanus]